jgi:hypothetical protein
MDGKLIRNKFPRKGSTIKFPIHLNVTWAIHMKFKSKRNNFKNTEIRFTNYQLFYSSNLSSFTLRKQTLNHNLNLITSTVTSFSTWSPRKQLEI